MIKDLFLLDPEIVFLNHGSFGATPRPVFQAYQAWQAELERRPIEFLGRRITELMAMARQSLSEYLGVSAGEVIYFPNPSTAINMVARNLARPGHQRSLKPGDEILTSDHEYGALDRTWRYISRLSGARYINRPMPLPLESPEAFVENFWAGVNQHTRIIFLSHITSPTALIFPVAEICRRAHQAGILTIIDGAHAIGQLPLNLSELGADIYTAACHKWLMAPKGSAFLYVRPEEQAWLDPLVVSWGYNPDPGYGSGQPYVDYHEWQGTRDMAAFLSVPAAIQFQKEHNWQAIRDRCHHLAVTARRQINTLTGLTALCPESTSWFGQMFSVRLPELKDPDMLQKTLYQRFQVEVPVMTWNNQTLMRVSVQGYNNISDIEALVEALERLLPI